MRAFEEIPVSQTKIDRQVPTISSSYSMSGGPLKTALGRPAVTDLLVERLLALDPDHWAIASVVAQSVISLLEWLPAGKVLGQPT